MYAIIFLSAFKRTAIMIIIIIGVSEVLCAYNKHTKTPPNIKAFHTHSDKHKYYTCIYIKKKKKKKRKTHT